MARTLNNAQKEALSTAMMQALREKDIETLHGCIDMGGDVNLPVGASDGMHGGRRPLLHWMSIYFDEPIAELLLKSGDLEGTDSEGNTPLMRAVMHGKPDPVAFFMKYGADPLAQNKNGHVVLEAAQRVSGDAVRKKIIKLLCQTPGKHAAATDNKKAFNDNAAALPHDIPVTTPILMKPPKKTGGDLEL